MRLKRKVKRGKKYYFLFTVVCILLTVVALTATAYIVTDRLRDKYESLLDEANKDIRLNERSIYIATTDILAGSIISADNADIELTYVSQPIATYITHKDIGSTALIDIPLGMHIQKNMLTRDTISSELRELEYDSININANIVSNDTVDVRLVYPNGESYVVLSKKVIKGLQPESVICYFWLDEVELLRMSAAIVDAGIYEGSRLYVTKYIEPIIQKASKVNYIPSLSVISLIENDPNVVERYSQKLNKEVRKALEYRLVAKSDASETGGSWNIDPTTQEFDGISEMDNIHDMTVPDNNGYDVDSRTIPDNNGYIDETDTGNEDGTNAFDESLPDSDEYYYYNSNNEVEEVYGE